MTAPLADSGPPKLMARLRTETRQAHDAIEGALDLDAALATRDAYRRLLIRFYVFHAGWEPALAGLIGDAAFVEPRRKQGLLGADLADLGLTAAQIAALAPCAPSPPLASISEAFGAMYVLEGSTLGGQLISRQVAARLGLGPDDGARYYHAYGRDVGAMWRAFGQRLNQAAPELDADQVVA
ncbi:MAG: biliverdin-producing heme oxygenase, partial [Caulobacteraceae bacterium]